MQAIHGMREGFFNLSAFNLSATVSGFVKGQLDEAQAAIDDWRSDMRLAERLGGGGGWRGAAKRARAKLRAKYTNLKSWWRGNDKLEL